MLKKVTDAVGKVAAESWRHYLRGLWWSGLRKLLGHAESTGFDGLTSTLERRGPPNNKERQIAEEGLEQAQQTSQKRPPVFKGEAKPEAVFVDGLPNVTALATWLSQNLSDEQLTELALQLHQVTK